MAPPSKILVVDDDNSIRMLFQISLEGDGFTVEAAEDGQAGLDKVKTFKPDIIVLDLMMPQLNGFQVARHLQESPETARIKILVVTGYGDEAEQRAITREPNVVGLLLKPVRPKELCERVRAALKS